MLDIAITGEYNMSEASEAFEHVLGKASGKVYLYPWENAPQK